MAMTSPLRTCELKSALSRAIVPDTCDPTWTLTTAFTMPVASTASRISPLTTFEARYCTLSPRRRNAVAASAATVTIAINHHHFLFITKGLDGIHERGFARRVIAEEDSDGDGEE